MLSPISIITSITTNTVTIYYKTIGVRLNLPDTTLFLLNLWVMTSKKLL